MTTVKPIITDAQSRRENQTTAFKEAGFAPKSPDGTLFDYDFEKSLGYHLGEQFYACIPQVRALVPKLKASNAVGYDNRIERNGVDGYIWLEKEVKNLLVLGFKNQNVMYLVYIVTKFGDDEIHVRQIWSDYLAMCRSGNYMLGKPDWDSINNPGYIDAICHAETAVKEYSDDFYDEQGKQLTPYGHFVTRPSLTTHQKWALDNVGMRYKDGRDKGYIASVKVSNLTEKPYCESPNRAMQTPLEYIFMDFKLVLNLPCLDGDEAS
jgi:hypothetical protein